MKKPMSISEFARKLGLTEGAVRKAIKSGRIPEAALTTITAANGAERTAVADPLLAAECWAGSSAPSRFNLRADFPDVDDEEDATIKKFRAFRAMASVRWMEAKKDDAYSRLFAREKKLVSVSAVTIALAATEAEMLDAARADRRQLRRILSEFITRVRAKVDEERQGSAAPPGKKK